MKNVVAVALGSNLSSNNGIQPENLLIMVGDLLQKLFPEEFLMAKIMESSPLGPQDQPNYFNSVVKFQSDFAPQRILNILKGIEVLYGRQHRRRWGERELDLDLLFCGNICLNQERLILPHSQMKFRSFVLKPLEEIYPDWIHPQSGESLKSLIHSLEEHKINEATS